MSEGPLYRDPWARREAWRKSPIFSNRAMFRNMFPGFGIGLAAFTVYVVADNLMAKGAQKAQAAEHH